MSIQDRMRHIYESQIHQLGGTLVGGRSKSQHMYVSAKSPWIRHVQEYRYDHPELSYKEAMQEARESYTHPKKRGIHGDRLLKRALLAEKGLAKKLTKIEKEEAKISEVVLWS